MPAIIAKISRPAITDIFPRERLFQQLDLAVKRPVVWLSAPAGFGKTILVASYLDARKLSSLWYQVDEGDADIASFFNYMGLAADNVGAASSPPLPLFTKEYPFGIAAFSRRFFEELYTRLKSPSVIVLNNYQKMSLDSVFHEVVSHGLNVIPPGVTVIIISRSSPPENMSRFKMEKQLATIGWSELKLTLDETEGIVSRSGWKTIPSDTLRSLHDKAQGWAAGVVLMMESLESAPQQFPAFEEVIPEEVFTYFSSEIFTGIDDETRHFLLKTSFFPKMTVPMANALTGSDKADCIFSYLMRNNLFTLMYPHREIGSVYQYHRLFRGFLQSCVRSVYSGKERVALQREAAAILAQSGQKEEAGELLRGVGDWEGLAGIAIKEAPKYFAQGRAKVLEIWFAGVPEAIFAKSPWLAYFVGLSKMGSDPPESQRLLKTGFDCFEHNGDPAGIYLAWSAIVNSHLYGWGDFRSLDCWIERLGRIMNSIPFPSPEVELQVSTAMVSALTWRQLSNHEIAWWTERVLALSSRVGDLNLRTQALTSIGFYHFWMGDLVKGNMMIDELSAITKTSSPSSLNIITATWMQAAACCARAMPQEVCIGVVEEGLAEACSSGMHLCDHMLYACGVFAALNWDDTALAAGYLKNMESILNSGQNQIACYYYLVSWWNLLQGDHLWALAHAEKSLAFAAESGNAFLEMLTLLAVTQAAYETGDYAKATNHLERAIVLIDRTGSRVLTFMYLVIKAYFAFSTGEGAAGGEHLLAALNIGKQQEYMGMVWWWRPSVMASLCCKALETGIQVEYVREMIRKRKLVPDAPPVHLENWPWPIKIYTLGRFSILINEKPLSFTGKVQQKPLALLKAMISLGGRDIPVEKLIDLLWPDAEGDDGHKSFTIALHRLRRMLENDRAIQSAEGKITLDNRRCWLDTWAFERLCGAVENATKNGSPEKYTADAAGIMERASRFYHGHFLSGDTTSPWAISMRERLRLKAIHMISICGGYYESCEGWQMAVENYLRGLDIDDYVEEFHQRLMICLHKLGRPGEALAAYTRCRKVLANIGGKPTQKTQTMYQALLDGCVPEV